MLEDCNSSLYCSDCDTGIAIPRSIAGNPEKRVIFKDWIERDHQSCEEYDNPVQARAAYLFRKRVESELKKQSAGTPASTERA